MVIATEPDNPQNLSPFDRSIIHQKCYIMIGMHSDSIEELEKSIKYLKKYSKVVWYEMGL